jgi:hypothetical protein
MALLIQMLLNRILFIFVTLLLLFGCSRRDNPGTAVGLTPADSAPVLSDGAIVADPVTTASGPGDGLDSLTRDIATLDPLDWAYSNDAELIVEVIPLAVKLNETSSGLAVTKSTREGTYLALRRGIRGPYRAELTLRFPTADDVLRAVTQRFQCGVRMGSQQDSAQAVSPPIGGDPGDELSVVVQRFERQVEFLVDGQLISSAEFTKDEPIEQLFFFLMDPGTIELSEFRLEVADDVAGTWLRLPVEQQLVGPRPTVFDPRRSVPEETVILVDGAIDDVAVGGGGRFLALYDQAQRRLAVVDVQQQRLAGYIPADDENLQFAAGIDTLVLVLPGKREFQSWSLETLTLANSRTFHSKSSIKRVAMGSASHGPLLTVFTRGDQPPQLVWLDPYEFQGATLQSICVENIDWDGLKGLWASADGTTFGLVSDRYHSIFASHGRAWIHSDKSRGGDSLVPSPAGDCLVGHHGRVYDPMFADRGGNYGWLAGAPAHSGPFIVGLQPLSSQKLGIKHCAVGVFTRDSPERYCLIPDADITVSTNDGQLPVRLSADKRIHLYPNLDRFASIPRTNDRVVIRPFDLQGALRASSKPLLFLDQSERLPVAASGESYRHQLVVHSAVEPVEFSVSGPAPDGLEVSADGEVTYQTPILKGTEPFVIRFRVRIRAEGIARNPQLTLWVAPSSQLDATEAELVSRLFDESVADPPAPETIVLPAAVTELEVANGGKYLVLHLPSLNLLTVFDTARRRIIQSLPLRENALLLAAGQDRLAAYFHKQQRLVMFRLPSLEVLATRKLDFQTVQSMEMPSVAWGPLLLNATVNGQAYGLTFLNPSNLEPLTPLPQVWRFIPWDQEPVVRASAGGEWWVVTVDNDWHLLRYTGTWILLNPVDTNPSYKPRDRSFACPDPTGRTMLTNAGQRLKSGKIISAKSHMRNSLTIPSDLVNYYVAVENWGDRTNAASDPSQLGVCISRVASRPLLSVADPSLTLGSLEASLTTRLTPDKRILLLARERVLITLGATNDRLRFHPVNLEAALTEESTIPLQFVTQSYLLPSATAGETVEFPIKVLSQPPSVFFELVDGPLGMRISTDGFVKWKVPSDFAADEVAFRVRAQDDQGGLIEVPLQLRVD